MSGGSNVDHALTCCRCGYDLRGIPLGGNCPECGESIVTTIANIRSKRSRRRYMWSGAASCVVLHAVILISALMIENQEAASTLVGIMDFPVIVLVSIFGGGRLLFGDIWVASAIFLVGGSVIYSLLGSLIGYVLWRDNTKA